MSIASVRPPSWQGIRRPGRVRPAIGLPAKADRNADAAAERRLRGAPSPQIIVFAAGATCKSGVVFTSTQLNLSMMHRRTVRYNPLSRSNRGPRTGGAVHRHPPFRVPASGLPTPPRTAYTEGCGVLAGFHRRRSVFGFVAPWSRRGRRRCTAAGSHQAAAGRLDRRRCGTETKRYCRCCRCDWGGGR